MRSFHPSGKAVLVAGALAVTLVIGATSGAVAGRLITSKDIKNGTITSVDLSKGVRAQLKKAGTPGATGVTGATGAQGAAGAPGPAGPAGPAGTNGAAGADGADGADGAPGDGSLVATRTYDRVAEDVPETGAVPVVQLEGDGSPIELATGNYLVSVQGIFSSFSAGPGAGLIFVGDDVLNEDDASAIMRACVGFYIPVCNATVPVTVQDGETLDLNVYWASLDSCSSDCGSETPAVASLSVYKVGGELAVPSPIDPCAVFGCSEEAPLRAQLKQLERQLQK